VKEKFDTETGEITPIDLDPPVKVINKIRPDGTTSVTFDYTGCPSKTEPHHYNETNLDYLVKKYKPDELIAYLQARTFNRNPQFHDFNVEPNLQDAMNIRYKLNKKFQELPTAVQAHFGNVLNYMRFIDNPDNIPALQKMGLLKTPTQTETQNKNQTQTHTQTSQTQTKTTENPNINVTT
jgi:hypothetical protein